MELVDLALRGAATGICLILISLFWMSRISLGARSAFVMLVVTTLARLWSTLPPATALADPTLSALRLMGTGGAFCVTWFLLSIFLDNKRFGWAWLLSGATISGAVMMVLIAPGIVPYVRGYAVLHFAALLALILYSARGDLQDARRRFRPGVAAFLLIYAIGMALTSTSMETVQPVNRALGHAAAYLLITLIFALWSLKANINHWPGETDPVTIPSPVQRSLEQSALVTRIQTEMQAGVWQVEGLTVAALAQRVKAPEHQVRKAINQGLGHRNFASFINSARIDAAKAKLRAPDAAEVTILEIAYDVGFASLGPFNRAFREATGLSPTDFRKQAGP